MRVTIGYMAAQEQYDPLTLLERTVLAEKHGFETIWTSDHFHPWAHTNASGGFAWVWLAAAAERTSRVKLGTGVTAPILRYNPAIVAQAFATLGFLYPGRIFLSVGTGEAMNEIPVGVGWPNFRERVGRLEEAIILIRRLWSESFVDFDGRYYKLKKANLYTKPSKPIPTYVAANGPTVAYLAGKYADGFVTLPANLAYYKEALFPALEKGAKDAGRDAGLIDKVVELVVSYDEDSEKALRSCKFWSAMTLPTLFKEPIWDPREIEEMGNHISDEALLKNWIISDDLDEHLECIDEYIEVGFNHIHIQSSSPDEDKFIKSYGKRIIPRLHERHT